MKIGSATGSAFTDTLLTPRERRLLGVVRAHGAISRSDLIQLLDLPGPAVFRATEELATRGFLEIGAGVAKGRGQPSASISLKPDAFLTIGLSVMTDQAEAVLMDLSGAVIAVDTVSAPGMNMAAVLDNLEAFAAYGCAKRGVPVERIGAAGVAVAGYFLGDGTELNPGPELDDWALVDLEAHIGQRLRLPVEIENVAAAAAMGEALLGVGLHAPSFAYLSIAAGLGCGIVIDGELLRGRRGNAGEIAVLPEHAGLIKPTLEGLRQILDDHGVTTGGVGDLVTHYDDDWPGIEAWVAEAAPVLSMLALTLHYVLDPDAIVVGGRIPKQLGRRLVHEMRWPDENRPARRDRPASKPLILAAELETRSAAIGAAAMPLKRRFFAPDGRMAPGATGGRGPA